MITDALKYRPFKQASCPVVIQVIIQSKNDIVKETFLFCSIEGFRFPRFIKHSKLKFSSALEFLRRFDADCLDSGPLFILFRLI